MESGLVFDIKRYSTHDGPGIRTTVHLQGCPLSCWWCHNPEGKRMDSSVHYDDARCIGCETCVDTCPEQALELTPLGVDIRLEKRCIALQLDGEKVGDVHYVGNPRKVDPLVRISWVVQNLFRTLFCHFEPR